MGQTDRRTDAVPFHRPCCEYYASSVKKAIVADGSQDSVFGYEHERIRDKELFGRGGLSRVTVCRTSAFVSLAGGAETRFDGESA